ncbi:MAG: PAQR family membrane homeostasis protein TrhA [Bacteroidales bacterium]
MSLSNRRYSFAEEVFNSVSHGIGAGLGIAGLVIMVIFAAFTGDPWKIVSSVIFGASLIFMYTSSTLYHAFGGRKRVFFNKMDHAAIYILIAGTYTPFMLVTLRGPWGWSIFGAIWAMAIAGILFKMFWYTKKLRTLSAVIYLMMGWLVIIAIKPLINNLPTGGLWWLVAGGLSYSLGVVFYLVKKIPFGHGIWHLFVLGGSICHYFAILFFVI